MTDASIPAHTPAFDGTKAQDVDGLLAKCQDLHQSVLAFQSYLSAAAKESAVDLRTFRNYISAELRTLERLSAADPDAPNTGHAIRSTNLPFLLAVWNAAKQCPGVTAFSKRFFAHPSEPKSTGRRKGALVDLVACDGELWIKVSTITERSLLYELAKAGWESGWGDEDEADEDGTKVAPQTISGLHYDDEEPEEGDEDDEDDGRIELLRLAGDLANASRSVKVRYRHPQVLFVFPNIAEGSLDAVDKVLSDLRATGARVHCGPGPLDATDLGLAAAAWPPAAPDGSGPGPGSEDGPRQEERPDGSAEVGVFERMAPSPWRHLTGTLNLDCTILLALVSDLSHATLAPDAAHHRAINKQIAIEAASPLLPSSLYPALRGRRLVCSGPAARRMREIVAVIGTPAEKARAAILLAEGEGGNDSGDGDDDDDDDAAQHSTPDQLRARLGQLSQHSVPADLRLPVRVLPGAVDESGLPREVGLLLPLLSEINRSVFFLGWAHDWTTVTSNRTVAKQVESVLQAAGDAVVGPRVWISETARSLVGKEKNRRS